MNIIKNILENASNINNLTQSLITILGSILAITGIQYLNVLKKKKTEVEFSYWTQLLIRLNQILNRLNTNEALINNFYSHECRNSWETVGASVRSEDIKDFIDIVQETIEFIKNTPDQIPAYQGWTTDYKTITVFLDDIFLFDILNPDEHFKYSSGSIEDRERENELIKRALNRMTKEIEEHQKKTEARLCREPIFLKFKKLVAKIHQN